MSAIGVDLPYLRAVQTWNTSKNDAKQETPTKTSMHTILLMLYLMLTRKISLHYQKKNLVHFPRNVIFRYETLYLDATSSPVTTSQTF